MWTRYKGPHESGNEVGIEIRAHKDLGMWWTLGLNHVKL